MASKKFLGALKNFRKMTVNYVMFVSLSLRQSVYLSVYVSAWYKSAPIGRIFMRFDI